MNPNDIIADKNSGKSIRTSDLHSFISGYVEGTINDETMTGLLRAIFNHGMTDDEIFTMVDIMIHSGKQMNFEHIDEYVCDKHSIGGVGDKTSLIIAPLLASAGLYLPMIAGRSLGHTGGTLDKLETIPGFRADISIADFQTLVKNNGAGIMAQTSEICPADGKIYALRDVTGTVASVPLIVGSIMSKKIAEGIQGLVLDIKVGSGAFLPTVEKAKVLADMLKKVGEHFGVKTDLVYTNMDQPLGNFSGMACEVLEAIDCLKGKGPEDTMAVCLKLSSKLMIQSGKAKDETESNSILTALIKNGSAFDKFDEMISIQGGDLNAFTNTPAFTHEIIADKSGIIQSMDTTQIGWGLVDMGCGRKNKDDILDATAGLECHYKIGEDIKNGDVLFTCFCDDGDKLKMGIEKITDSVSIGTEKVDVTLIYN
ncbi:MAG TPA: thymidine phosphorylase [Candidatus Marinimicrobia bacterium]|nr:thymidine phosphorylase [Candidatus Neomarinimicrobiota bacterium]